MGHNVVTASSLYSTAGTFGYNVIETLRPTVDFTFPDHKRQKTRFSLPTRKSFYTNTPAIRIIELGRKEKSEAAVS